MRRVNLGSIWNLLTFNKRWIDLNNQEMRRFAINEYLGEIVVENVYSKYYAS